MKKDIIEVQPIDVSNAPQILKESKTILHNAKAIVISTQPAYLESDVVLKKVKAKISELDAQRKEITGPLDKAKAAVMALFKPPITLLQEAEGIIKTAQIGYLDEQERIRQEKEEKLRRQADEERRKKEAQEAEWRRKEEEARREAEALAKKAAIETNAKKRAEAEAAAAKAQAEADKAAAKAEERAVEAATIVAPTVALVEVAKGSAVVTRWFAEITDIALVPREYMLPNMKLLDGLATKMKDQVKIPGVAFKSERGISSRKTAVDVGF